LNINNCKANLKKWVIYFRKALSKDHLSCVNDYQKVHNSLRVLGIKNWEKEGSEIIALLKDQEVDVVSYKYISIITNILLDILILFCFL
jgi:hypothetical protein